jgi:Sec-independent protein translocase protein TatA
MRLGKLLTIAFIALFLFGETQTMPFMMSMGQAIGGAFFSIWKAFDNTPQVAHNRTNMKRAPAFASKYSASKTHEATST